MAEDASEPLLPDDETNDLSVADFRKYVKAYERPCEVCGSDAWSSVTGEDNKTALASVLKPFNPELKGYDFRCYTAICLSCGNMKMFNTYVVKKNLEDAASSLKESTS